MFNNACVKVRGYLLEMGFLFLPPGFGYWAQIGGLGNRRLYPRSHFTFVFSFPVEVTQHHLRSSFFFGFFFKILLHFQFILLVSSHANVSKHTVALWSFVEFCGNRFLLCTMWAQGVEGVELRSLSLLANPFTCWAFSPIPDSLIFLKIGFHLNVLCFFIPWSLSSSLFFLPSL